MRRTQENFLKQCKKEVPRAKNLHVGAGEAQFNERPEALRKDDRVHQEREQRLCDK